MKNYYLKTIFLLFFACLLSQCENLLDEKPRNVKLEEDAIKNATDIQHLLNSAYDMYRSPEFMGGNLWAISELMADHVEGGNIQGSLAGFYNRSTSIFSEEVRDLWSIPYIVIYRCNLVLRALGRVNGLKPEERARFRGQALFLRASCHFELVRMFAQPSGFNAGNTQPGVVLRLLPNQNPALRNTVSEVYSQIITDLNTAVQELPGDIVPGTANVWAAKALLAKVYFQQNNFELAYTFAQDVADNGPAIFSTNIQYRMSKTRQLDVLFDLPSVGNTLPGQQNGERLQAYFKSTTGRPPLGIVAGLYNSASQDTSDLRGKHWVKYFPGTVSQPPAYYSTKYNNDDIIHIPVIHLAEIKLIFAECAAEKGRLTLALAQLNEVRRRAGLPSYNSLYDYEIIDEIRKQRSLEMMLEGNRLHELKRQATLRNRNLRIRNAPWDCNGLVVVLPDIEISANPNIVQNPTGGCQ